MIVMSNSFSIEDPVVAEEKVVPVLDTNKIKYRSNGSLDKRIIIIINSRITRFYASVQSALTSPVKRAMTPL